MALTDHMEVGTVHGSFHLLIVELAIGGAQYGVREMTELALDIGCTQTNEGAPLARELLDACHWTAKLTVSVAALVSDSAYPPRSMNETRMLMVLPSSAATRM